MGTRVSYTLVGTFVVAMATAMVAAGLWLASGLRTSETAQYSVYLRESAAGLGRDSPVTYRGVEVGQVQQLDLDPSRPQRVHVIIGVRANLPLREGVTATMKTRGVTGISYLNLSGGDPQAAELEAPQGEPYPVIPYRPSLLAQLNTAAGDGLGTLQSIGAKLEEVLSDDNRRALSQTLDNLARASAALATNADRLDGLAGQSERLLERANEGVAQVPETLAEVERTAGAVEEMAGNFAAAGEQITALGQSGREGLRTLNERTLPRVDALIDELRLASQRLRRLVESLRRSPEQLLYGPPRREPGPGEE